MKTQRYDRLINEKDFDQRKNTDETRVVEEKEQKSRKYKYMWTQKGNLGRGGI
ncbi:MAG: hypothetical protein ACFE9D_10220 [Promethearchaeota archaeon]